MAGAAELGPGRFTSGTATMRRQIARRRRRAVRTARYDVTQLLAAVEVDIAVAWRAMQDHRWAARQAAPTSGHNREYHRYQAARAKDRLIALLSIRTRGRRR
jgi:hypothetical protein